MVQERFARVDADHDNYVTRAEAEARAAARGAMQARGDGMDARRGEAHRGERRAAMFDRLDANHDGSISRAEFDAAGAARAERREGREDMRRGRVMRGGMAEGGTGRGMRGGMAGGGFGPVMFERLDADHDGRVSLAEASARALAMFDRADADRNGTVTPEERRAAWQRFREERQSRRGG
jgi:Ca2+-binding EF-hand superfamily protein